MKRVTVILLAAFLIALTVPAFAMEADEAPMVKSVLLPPGEEAETDEGGPVLPDPAQLEAGEQAGPELDPTTQQAGDVQLPEADEDGTVPEVIMTLEKPALPLVGVKIGIDPGHQAHGNNERETVAPNSSQTKAKVSSGTSGVATGIAEYVTVLDISLKLRDALLEQGAEVYMTRESHDVNISNQERAKMLNDAGVDLMLRIHCDGAGNRSKHGIALYCSRSNSIAGESRRAAEAILPAVCAATGAKNNGIVSNDDYTGQNWATVPCIMVECGFMSNPEEDRLLNDEAYQQKLAVGLTQGIVDYIAIRDE